MVVFGKKRKKCNNLTYGDASGISLACGMLEGACVIGDRLGHFFHGATDGSILP